jgi:type IV pilus assembly protein PilV
MNFLSRNLSGGWRRSAGFSLIEVLVSILVLSFGLLGMVGLQAAALKTNRDARLQSSAIVLAREMAEMMRGNKQVALTPANPYIVAQVSHPLVAVVPQYCLAVGSACADSTQTAQAEVTDWLARVDAELPGAVVAICADTQPYDPASGLPVWTCTPSAGAPGATITDPIVIKIGWSRMATQDGTANDEATRPSVILSVTPGNSV